MQNKLSFPDYVFAPGYKLLNLSKVEQFVSKNYQLPKVPSAKEIEK